MPGCEGRFRAFGGRNPNALLRYGNSRGLYYNKDNKGGTASSTPRPLAMRGALLYFGGIKKDV